MQETIIITSDSPENAKSKANAIGIILDLDEDFKKNIENFRNENFGRPTDRRMELMQMLNDQSPDQQREIIEMLQILYPEYVSEKSTINNSKMGALLEAIENYSKASAYARGTG